MYSYIQYIWIIDINHKLCTYMCTYFIYVCLYIEWLPTTLSCKFFYLFFLSIIAGSLKRCSAWEESQTWQLPKLQAFLSLMYADTGNVARGNVREDTLRVNMISKMRKATT